MSFNPDEFLADKQAENPVGPAPSAFDPDAFIAPEPQANSNPPTPLSAAVHGFESGFTYNTADEAGNLLDKETGARFKASQEAYPIINGLAQIVGSFVSPNPLGKIKSIKEAGTLAKMAIAGTRVAGETGLAALGGSDKADVQGRIEDMESTLSDPLTAGIGLLATLAPGLPSVIRKGSNLIVKDGKKAVALGKGIEEALGSDKGQELVSKAVGEFEQGAIATVKDSMNKLQPELQKIVAQNADVEVNVRPALERTFNFLSKVEDDTLLDHEKAAKKILSNFISAEDDASSAFSSSEAVPFANLYELKQKLGKLIFDPTEGAARKFNAAPQFKKEAMALYDNVSKAMKGADKTRTYGDVADAYTGLFKLQDAADDLGNSMAQMADKLNVKGVQKRDAIVKAYKSIPPQYLPAMPELSDLITNKMDDVITAYNISSKIAGKAPQRANPLMALISKLPVVSEGSRLGLLNRLGREEAGFATKTINNPATTRSLRAISAPMLTPNNPQALQPIE